ncbi:MAG TPA: lipoprotein-releasing ABC transporter permease subunit [Burkholderiaceae bacterium]
MNKWNWPFEWRIGMRYTRGGRRAGRNAFISFISLISMSGIALGVAALIVVMSVMNGFQREVRDRMLSVLAHVEVIDAGGTRTWDALAKQAQAIPDVVGTAPFLETNALIVRGETMRPAIVRGILPARERTVSDLAVQMRSGALEELQSGSGNVLLGRELASALHVEKGGRVTLALPSGMDAGGTMPRLRQFTVAGIFEAGHFEFDSTLAYVHVDDSIAKLDFKGPIGLRIKTADMSQAPAVAQQLRSKLPADVLVTDWTKLNKTWFAAVQSQKLMLSIIVTMIMAVATFNLVSTLVMTVTDKQADIAILRTLGASPGSVMKIFMLQGVLVGVLGTLAGVLIGALVAHNIGAIVASVEAVFHISVLPKDVYLIDTMPSEIRWLDVAVVAVVALVLALISTLYPSWSAARTSAAQALRHE